MRTVLLDNEAVAALTDPTHRKHRVVVAHLAGVVSRRRKGRHSRVVVATAVRVEAGWDRSDPAAAAVNRYRVTDAPLDGPAADVAARLVNDIGVSVADAHLGAVVAGLDDHDIVVLTSDPPDSAHHGSLVTCRPARSTMSAMTTLHVPHDGWTVDELPDDLPFRYELVDGALLVTPPPRLRHDDLAVQLLLRLAPGLPEHWRIAPTPGLFVDARNYRQPDVVVYERGALDKDRIEPADAVLVIEVMSPGSVSNDRVTKPAQYAAVGIEHFWRVELDPLVLVVHELDGAVYRETGRFADQVVLEEPLRLRFRLADLLA